MRGSSGGRDPCGAEYDRQHELGTREFFDEIERHRYSEYAAWMPLLMGFQNFRDARLLEVGCGMGTDLLQFSRGGARCVGIDLTPPSIELTQHRFNLYGADGEFMISDGEHLPFRDESFDVVYSNGVLHRNSLNYGIEIVLRRGVLGAEFLRGRSAEEIMSRVIEFSDHEARPLVKVYSRSEARKLFRLFKDVKIDVEQLTRAELRFLSPVVSESMTDRLRKRIGWNVIITATK